MSEIALIGKKIGMTREFYKSGQLVPVTIIKMEKARVIQVIDKEKRGYTAVQLGYGKIKNSKLSKAMKGYFAKKNTEPKKLLKEFKVNSTENYKEGNEFGLEIFNDIKFVDVKLSSVGLEHSCQKVSFSGVIYNRKKTVFHDSVLPSCFSSSGETYKKTSPSYLVVFVTLKICFLMNKMFKKLLIYMLMLMPFD